MNLLPYNEIIVDEDMTDLEAVLAEDLFGKLTNDVLIDILSHLPIKEVVKTAILSKRWKGLWKLVDILDFSNLVGNTLEHSNLVREKFEQFVTQVLKHNDVKVLRRLVIDAESVRDETKQIWFNEFRTREVAQLYLRVNAYMNNVLNYPIPSRIFNLSTLVELDLYGFVVRGTYNFGDHPTIKYVKLEMITFDDAQFISNFLYACPNLFELELNCCLWPSEKIIINSNLKKLCLDVLNCCAEANGKGKSLMMKLDTPKLKTLFIHDSIAKFECVEFMEIIEVVVIAVLDDGDEDRMRTPLKMLLESCSKMKSLTLKYNEAFRIARECECQSLVQLRILVTDEMAYLVKQVPSLRFCLSYIMKDHFPLLNKLVVFIEKEEDEEDEADDEGDQEFSCFFPPLLKSTDDDDI